jgi:UDP-glucose 4-epimerase
MSYGEGRESRAPRPNIEYVFHLAAQPGVRGSWGIGFDPYIRSNVLATQRLLEAAKDVPLKKFVFASSSSVYGDAEALPTSEDVVPRPVSPYGVTKLAAEHLCLLYWRNYGLPVTCPRYFSVYGPRQRPDMAFYRFIKAMLKNQEIVIYGDGEQTRDFSYVDDIVEATVRSGTADLAGRILNIGSGSRVTLNETIRLLESILGKQARVRYVESQSGDVRHTAADITRATTVLGFRPQTSLADGLQAEVQWLAGDFHGTG